MRGHDLVARLLDFRRLDLLAGGESATHRLDARAKIVVTMLFIACAMSFDRHAIAPLMPMFVFPIAVAASSGLPLAYLARKVALVVPIAVLIGLPNLWFEREPALHLGELVLSGGAVSLLSIVLRAVLATAAAIVLVAVTGFPALCEGLERLGAPRALAVQLLFLYRYLTVLGEEAQRMTLARALRANGRPLQAGLFSVLIGRLLLRTWDRAERIHLAMCARGFTGVFHSGARTRFGMPELLFVAAWAVVILMLRFQDAAHWLGALLLGGSR